MLSLEHSLGRWHGFAFQNGLPIYPMLSFRFRVSPDHACYEATEVAADGTQYTVLGGYMLQCDDTVEYKFTWMYAMGLPKAYFSGIIDGDVGRLSGSWGFDEDDTPFQFLFFKDVPPEVVVARPLVFEFEENC
ncbi:hypothetical protein BN946_scf184871.g1 [Trametes cinnabarina]|uniref:DUF1579 domain-containing protein n=1 Tax=Pycnoporus cinnabarinus TaxID=5643 RepID=A0A060SM91_PYCCI|nr:hypothetical protein BN946_scf184871.g1 [Trametes cinnabarina]